MKDLHGLTIGVVGLGDSGLSALRWLARRGARLVAIDSRTAPPHLAELAQLAPRPSCAPAPSPPTALPAASCWWSVPGVLATPQIVAFARLAAR